jgi:hypothetical protein
MNDLLPTQIPENTTYQATIEQQQSPPSYQLSPGSISSQGTIYFKAHSIENYSYSLFRRHF